MAIQTNFILQNGLEVKNCYLRIDIMRGNKGKVGFNLVPYQDNNAIAPLEEGSYFEFTPSQDENAERWDKQAYDYAKTLPQFENAIDV